MSDRHPGKSIGQRSEVAAGARKEIQGLEYDAPREPTGYHDGYSWSPEGQPGSKRQPLLAAEGRIMGFVDEGQNYTFAFNDATREGDLRAGGFSVAMGKADAIAFADAPEQTRQAVLVQYVRAAEARRASQGQRQGGVR